MLHLQKHTRDNAKYTVEYMGVELEEEVLLIYHALNIFLGITEWTCYSWTCYSLRLCIHR